MPDDSRLGGKNRPDGLSHHGLTLSAYSLPRELVLEEHCLGRDLEEAAARILDRSEVDFIHMRDGEAGCYDFRLERH